MISKQQFFGLVDVAVDVLQDDWNIKPAQPVKAMQALAAHHGWEPEPSDYDEAIQQAYDDMRQTHM